MSTTAYTPPALARLLGVRADTVVAWIRAGELPAVDVSRPGTQRPRYRVLPDEWERFLRRRAVGVRPPPRTRRRRPDADPYGLSD